MCYLLLHDYADRRVSITGMTEADAPESRLAYGLVGSESWLLINYHGLHPLLHAQI